LRFAKRFVNSVKKIPLSKPKDFLSYVTKNYPIYFSTLGLYNSIWRYFDDKKISKKLLLEVSKERTNITKIYTEVELKIKSAVQIIGKEENFDGDLLRYFSIFEISKYLKSGKIDQNILKKAKKRKLGYLYFFQKQKEKIITDKTIIDQVIKNFSYAGKNLNEIKGFSAYQGKAEGRVTKNINKKGEIFVSAMTLPNDTLRLKKFSAIITDEGGILSHAAITAREFKIPCIIGTKIATQIFKDGDMVEVDANKGIIKKLR